MLMTRQCSCTDKKVIDSLLKAEYLKARQFTVNAPTALEWDVSDENHVVLACLDDKGMATATMRGFVVGDAAGMRAYMEAELPVLHIEYPCLVLTKAATQAGEQGVGLNSLLRYFFLDAADRCGIHTLAGGVFAGAARVGLMSRLGYRFVETGHVSYPVLTPVTQRTIALLDRPRFDCAISLLKEMVKQPAERYPWCGARLELAATFRTVL